MAQGTSSIENVAADLDARVAAQGQGQAASEQVATTSPQEQRDAWQKMAMSGSDDLEMPPLSLVSEPVGDNLKPAEIEVGGYNAVIGAKVPSQAEGVLTKLGRVYPDALPPGFHFKWPHQHVYMMPTNLIANTVRAQAGSHDLQQVTTEVTIPFHMNEGFGPKVYSKIGSLEKVEAVVINPGVLESLKAVTAQYTAEELITKRQEVKDQVEEKLKQYIATALKERGLDGAINIGNIAITHFEFSDGYNRSIEAKVKAAQDALRAESEKKQKITEAEGTREATKTKADGDAYAIEVTSKAEADAIKRRAEALNTNPGVAGLNAIDKWDGKLPVYSGGGNPVPFINVPGPEKPEEKKQ